MTTKVYIQCPLPFIGQKRHFLKQYRQTLLQVREEVDTIVDLFGGSGLLSHAAKRLMPECRVVYNDYDHYTNRIQHIPQTNELIQHIRQHLQGLKPDARLTPLQRSRVVKLVNEAQKHDGWVDAQTIGRSLLFSGRWVTSVSELKQQATMYNRVRTTPYNAEGYLDGLEIEHADYRLLYDQHKHNPKALFVLDPPYLTTECGMYGNYWRLTDYLDVLSLLKGTKYIYFTSSKSQLVELCEYLSAEYGQDAPMFGATVHEHNNHINHHSQYTDMMITRI